MSNLATRNPFRALLATLAPLVLPFLVARIATVAWAIMLLIGIMADHGVPVSTISYVESLGVSLLIGLATWRPTRLG